MPRWCCVCLVKVCAPRTDVCPACDYEGIDHELETMIGADQ